ncbi:ABC transporter ATP-binding protein [Dactylosporangium sp. NPDC048998]|uniref:ABC transporter ATP-binding protein n=1 Tax=Dactylosporangium sp. NPDC048998 TaxID=3363976 RepID=UPI0037234F24
MRTPVAGTAVLECRGLTAGYGGVPVVQDVDICVAAGEVVVLLGPNGAGKTTTLLTVAGDLPRIGGEILFDGESRRLPLYQRARRGLAFITEERSAFMSLTVRENLRLGRGGVDAALDLVPELAPLLDRRVGLLSGGEQQMLTVGRALAARPAVLLADELSLGLAPKILDRLLGLVRRAADDGVGVLMVEQQARKALRICDRGYVLSKGRVSMEGGAEDLLRRLPEIEAAYLSART